MTSEQIGNRLNARVDATRAGWRALGNVVEDLIKVGECNEVSQPVLGPRRPHLFVGRKFATRRSGL
jgi:hypothetical protein